MAVPLLMLAACASKDSPAPANAPRATVQMRDGGAASGAIAENTASQIKLLGADGVTRTIPMSQVRIIDYGDAPAPPPSMASHPDAMEPDPVHDRHNHPSETAATTKTYDLSADDHISIR